jgi:hypothetical protein
MWILFMCANAGIGAYTSISCATIQMVDSAACVRAVQEGYRKSKATMRCINTSTGDVLTWQDLVEEKE